MDDSPNILSLPEEVLVNLFECCDIQSLGRLACTCKKFKNLIYSEDPCWRERSEKVLGSNMYSREMKLRSKPILSYRKRCEVSTRWRANDYSRKTIVSYEQCMPWIYVDKQYLYCTKEDMLIQYPRRGNGKVSFNNVNWIIPHHDDVSKFVLNENEIVTAGRDGTLGRWRRGDLRYIRIILAHTHEVLCVDAKSNIIVTGSRDTMLKVWRTSDRRTSLVRQMEMDARVLSVAIMPGLSFYIVGLPGVNRHPLHVYDLETGEHIANLGLTFRRGAGILDIYPESEHTVLTCGYDTTVKLWDIRSPNDPSSVWMDPYDNGIYCVKSDHNVTIVSGASRNAVVHFWDKRRPGAQVVHQIGYHNSPAYGVAFDASHLFVAYDRSLIQFTYL